MKVLFLNNYHEGTGYSNAGLDYILALDSVGIDVVPRRLNITGSSSEIPNKIIELEKKSDKKPDIILTFSLPHFFSWTNKAKNVGMFSYETSNFKNSCWSRHLNLMDMVLVPNKQMMDACIASGVNRPIRIVPHSVDVSKFQKSYNKLDLPTTDFLFYFIGEVTRRKNLTAFVQAFHTEFDPIEPVSILIKASVPNMQPTEAYNFIASKCNEIKTGIKKFWTIDKYKPELILTDKLSENSMCALHRRCNCLVSPSMGEAWHLPTLDAMGFGNPVIVSNNTAFKDYVDEGCGALISCKETPVFGMIQTFQDLYTSEETWWEPDILELQKAMRRIYEDVKFRKQAGLKGMNRAFSFNWQQVGMKMKKYLENLLEK